MRGTIESILGREEHGPGGEHDGGIVQNPVVVEGDEVVNGLGEERMPLFCEHEVVGYADRDSAREDDRMYEEGVETAKTTNIQIEIYAAVVMEDKVADSIGALDGVGV